MNVPSNDVADGGAPSTSAPSTVAPSTASPGTTDGGAAGGSAAELSIVVDLYHLPPAQFTAARNARAKEIVAAGDRPLAQAVRGLSRPSASAWALNRLTADDGEAKDEVVRLGDALRDAQQNPNRETLSELATQRRALIARATKSIERLAAENEVALSASALIEVEQTLAAALADQNAASAAFSGRLVRPLQSIGLDEVDLSGAVGGPDAEPMVSPKHPSSKGASSATDINEAESTGSAQASHTRGRDHDRRAEREQARRLAAEAEDAATTAENSMHETQVALSEVESSRAHVNNEAADLTAQIAQLQARVDALQHQLNELSTSRKALSAQLSERKAEARRLRQEAAEAQTREETLEAP
ncbi:hypothetical protein [Subtercola lobariae]|uniref:Uncharacterized protein n=1 Tax=Subtercola lobariae TaxID=1588641 RepID=A0A917EZR6_9MICO|nr:hypothetical protein [Subtercola lobariae]GGF35919.1 hypothetical protein GCM10011399_31130 [Subtercola lobariae]